MATTKPSNTPKPETPTGTGERNGNLNSPTGGATELTVQTGGETLLPGGTDESQVATEPGLRIHARKPRWRRAGYEFTHEDRQLRLADLTAEQERALRDDPMLYVVDTAIPVQQDA